MAHASARFAVLGDPEPQQHLASLARSTPMRVGEVLVLSSTTGHGGRAHALDRTRVSFDVRVARVGDEPRGRLGWVSRPLV